VAAPADASAAAGLSVAGGVLGAAPAGEYVLDIHVAIGRDDHAHVGFERGHSPDAQTRGL